MLLFAPLQFSDHADLTVNAGKLDRTRGREQVRTHDECDFLAAGEAVHDFDDLPVHGLEVPTPFVHEKVVAVAARVEMPEHSLSRKQQAVVVWLADRVVRKHRELDPGMVVRDALAIEVRSPRDEVFGMGGETQSADRALWESCREFGGQADTAAVFDGDVGLAGGRCQWRAEPHFGVVQDNRDEIWREDLFQEERGVVDVRDVVQSGLGFHAVGTESHGDEAALGRTQELRYETDKETDADETEDKYNDRQLCYMKSDELSFGREIPR